MEKKKPKHMKDYSKGKIYKLWNEIDDRIYIGSTCQTLAQRMGEHRRCINKTRDKNFKLYQYMTEVGVDNFKIELLEECECENNDQVRKREGECIREHKPALNTRIEDRTRGEYYQDHRNEIRTRAREWWENNKDRHRETSAKWREENKERKSEMDRRYREGKGEELLENNAKYYQANKERLKEHRDENKEKSMQDEKT